MWPVTPVIWPVTWSRHRVVWRIRLRFLVESLVDFAQDLVSPIADRRPYAWSGCERDLSVCEPSSRKIVGLLFLPGSGRFAAGGAPRGPLLDRGG